MKDEVLPEFWQSVGLKQIATLYGGGTPARKNPAFFEGAIPWLTGADLSDEEVFSIRESREYITEEAIHKSATNPVPPKTVLITTRVNVGKVAVAEKEVCFSQDLTGIVIKEELQSVIDPYYIAYYLLANKARILRYDRGTTISGIQRRDLARFRVWLPPLPEQERIVEILREADELRRQQQAALTTAQTLIPALFHHMFGDPVVNPNHWDTLRFKDFTSDLHSGAPLRPPDFIESGFPVLHKGAIQVGGSIEIDPKKKTFTTENFAEKFDRSVVTKEYTAVTLRDLVPSGPSIGLISKLDRSPYEKYVLAQGAYAFIVDEEIVLSEYLVWLSNHPSFRNILLKLAVGSTQIHIRTPVFFNISIPIPPIDVQHQFASLVKDLRYIEELTHPRTNALEELFLSALYKAFTGDLTTAYREAFNDLLLQAVTARNTLLGHVRHATAPVIEEELHMAGVLMGRDTLAHSLSLSQRTLLQTIVTYLMENGRRYFSLSGFLDDHNNLPVNAVRQNVELLEKVGLLTRISRQVAPEGIPYFETFYRLTTALAREAAA